MQAETQTQTTEENQQQQQDQQEVTQLSAKKMTLAIRVQNNPSVPEFSIPQAPLIQSGERAVALINKESKDTMQVDSSDPSNPSVVALQEQESSLTRLMQTHQINFRDYVSRQQTKMGMTHLDDYYKKAAQTLKELNYKKNRQVCHYQSSRSISRSNSRNQVSYLPKQSQSFMHQASKSNILQSVYTNDMKRRGQSRHDSGKGSNKYPNADIEAMCQLSQPSPDPATPLLPQRFEPIKIIDPHDNQKDETTYFRQNDLVLPYAQKQNKSKDVKRNTHVSNDHLAVNKQNSQSQNFLFDPHSNWQNQGNNNLPYSQQSALRRNSRQKGPFGKQQSSKQQYYQKQMEKNASPTTNAMAVQTSVMDGTCFNQEQISNSMASMSSKDILLAPKILVQTHNYSKRISRDAKNKHEFQRREQQRFELIVNEKRMSIGQQALPIRHLGNQQRVGSRERDQQVQIDQKGFLFSERQCNNQGNKVFTPYLMESNSPVTPPSETETSVLRDRIIQQPKLTVKRKSKKGNSMLRKNYQHLMGKDYTKGIDRKREEASASPTDGKNDQIFALTFYDADNGEAFFPKKVPGIIDPTELIPQPHKLEDLRASHQAFKERQADRLQKSAFAFMYKQKNSKCQSHMESRSSKQQQHFKTQTRKLNPLSPQSTTNNQVMSFQEVKTAKNSQQTRDNTTVAEHLPKHKRQSGSYGQAGLQKLFNSSASCSNDNSIKDGNEASNCMSLDTNMQKLINSNFEGGQSPQTNSNFPNSPFQAQPLRTKLFEMSINQPKKEKRQVYQTHKINKKKSERVETKLDVTSKRQNSQNSQDSYQPSQLASSCMSSPENSPSILTSQFGRLKNIMKLRDTATANDANFNRTTLKALQKQMQETDMVQVMTQPDFQPKVSINSQEFHQESEENQDQAEGKATERAGGSTTGKEVVPAQTAPPGIRSNKQNQLVLKSQQISTALVPVSDQESPKNEQQRKVVLWKDPLQQSNMLAAINNCQLEGELMLTDVFRHGWQTHKDPNLTFEERLIREAIGSKYQARGHYTKNGRDSRHGSVGSAAPSLRHSNLLNYKEQEEARSSVISASSAMENRRGDVRLPLSQTRVGLTADVSFNQKYMPFQKGSAPPSTSELEVLSAKEKRMKEPSTMLDTFGSKMPKHSTFNHLGIDWANVARKEKFMRQSK